MGEDTENQFEQGILADSDWEWQLWVTKNLEHMIASGTYLPSPPRERISEAVSLCIDQVSEGVMNRFASLIEKKKNTVWGWQHGTAQIPLNDLLRICYVTQIPVVDFLHTQFVVPQDTELIPARPPVSGVKIKRQPPTLFDREKIDSFLRAILNQNPPPSMKEVAGTLKINKRSLYKHSSSLCRTISARHAEYQKTCCQERQNRHAIKIRQVADVLETNRIYPSRRRIALLLKKPSFSPIEGQPPSL